MTHRVVHCSKMPFHRDHRSLQIHLAVGYWPEHHQDQNLRQKTKIIFFNYLLSQKNLKVILLIILSGRNQSSHKLLHSIADFFADLLFICDGYGEISLWSFIDFFFDLFFHIDWFMRIGLNTFRILVSMDGGRGQIWMEK